MQTRVMFSSVITEGLMFVFFTESNFKNNVSRKTICIVFFVSFLCWDTYRDFSCGRTLALAIHILVWMEFASQIHL
jgi:hypothetical protein